MGEKVTRREAMALFGHDPRNKQSITTYIKKGLLTVYPGQSSARARGKKNIQLFDTDEIYAIIKAKADEKASNPVHVTVNGRLVSSGGIKLQGSAPDVDKRKEREAFEKETLSESQARELLGVGALALINLVKVGQIRTRKLGVIERLERTDVLAEQARRDRR